MAIITNGYTTDEDYAEYARRRLAAFLQAANLNSSAIAVNSAEGISLVVMLWEAEPEDLLLIPPTVDGLRVDVL